jgi:hypothetical protein
MKPLYKQIIDHTKKINWMLLLFLVLFLNVKLVLKVAAIIIISLWQFRSLSGKNILKQYQLYFYFSMMAIAVVNLLINLKTFPAHYGYVLLLGASLWLLAALASYHIFIIIRREELGRLYSTLTTFFVLHIGVVFLNLIKIMVECGSINPYTYKGFNQKYYLNTGDHLFGITYDSPVATALISAFALIYFLYRRHYIFSLAAAASLALIGSNLTNIFLALVLMFCFVFRSDRLQKSFIVLQLCILIIFLGKVSPRDNEYLGRVVYNITGKIYDLPKKNESIDFIKTQPDSLLDISERKRKSAQLYIDSLSAVQAAMQSVRVIPNNPPRIPKKDTLPATRQFYRFVESPITAERINRYNLFLAQTIRAPNGIASPAYIIGKPGKWVAYQELFHYFKNHPAKLITGLGVGNFSSRTAFKATALGMAGSFPENISYVNPSFRINHLYVYLNYHSQDQMKHAAANIPDSTYSQLLSEYGIIGLIAFLLFYVTFFLKRARRLTYGLPLLFLLMAAFSVEYLFEQLSIVVLFETLLFLDIKSNDAKSPQKEVGK